jgi:hypothetical protein
VRTSFSLEAGGVAGLTVPHKVAGKTDIKLSGNLLVAFFVMIFCCRFCQMSLLASVIYVPPNSESNIICSAPGALLLLLPSAVAAIATGYRRYVPTHFTAFGITLALAVLLAAASVIINWHVFVATSVTGSLILLSSLLEVGRICIWFKVLPHRYEMPANFSRASYILVEVAATATSIGCFRLLADVMPAVEALRIAALLLTITTFFSSISTWVVKLGEIMLSKFLSQYLQERYIKYESAVQRWIHAADKTGVKSVNPYTNRFSVAGYKVLAVGADIFVITLLTLVLTHRVIANVSSYDLFFAAAVGMSFGALYMMLPSFRIPGSPALIGLFLACAACLICICKPAGIALFVGLFFSGFSATIIMMMQNSYLLVPGRGTSLLSTGTNFRTVWSYLFSFIFTLLIESRIEIISSSALVRLVALSQLVFIILTAALSYMIYQRKR